MRRYSPILASVMLILVPLTPGCRSADITPAQSARRQFGLAVRLGTAYQVPGRSGRSDSVQPALGPSGIEGYVATVWCKSKSNLFPVRVVMDRDFSVLTATVLSYPSSRGRKIQSPRFTRQFQGKGPDDPLKIGKDIDAVSGATNSSKAMARGVKRAIRAAEEHYADSR
ncbi:MAG: FMN-binding protein [Phycisphaerae bacterium]|jgi:hypothetical protein|nr:FMN-binding protein [Phycisphaerae bacterium]MDP7288096.1 FMN-binding protein [Phycisphaerae bacterium]